jgi:hypothetical protein
MKHLILTRAKVDDKELLEKYLIVCQNILIPALQKQKNKNFVWGMLIKPEHHEYLVEKLKYPFYAFFSKDEFINYIKDNNVEIQTRHDIDDWMSEDYVDKIQKEYEKNKNKYDKFLIQFQPLKMNYHTRELNAIQIYTETRTSMFLTLCQNKVENHILDRGHGEMWQIAKDVITLPIGDVLWVIHGDNISCKKNMI